MILTHKISAILLTFSSLLVGSALATQEFGMAMMEPLEADFDGDGRADIARLASSPRGYAVQVELGNGQVLDVLDLGSLSDVKIDLETPGRFPAKCWVDAGGFCGEGQPRELVTDLTGIMVSGGSANRVLIYWRGGKFQSWQLAY